MRLIIRNLLAAAVLQQRLGNIGDARALLAHAQLYIRLGGFQK